MKKRGRALSISGVWYYLSAVVLPPLNAVLIEKYGWRETWKIWAALVVGIMFPVALCFYRSKPEDMGLDGEPVDDEEETEEDQLGRIEEEQVNWPFNEVVKTPVFWLLLITGCYSAAVPTALTYYIRDIGELSGITAI